MKKFEITVVETIEYYKTVQAESKKEAMKLPISAFDVGTHIFHTEIDVVDVEEV